jgi:hypothetical protein
MLKCAASANWLGVQVEFCNQLHAVVTHAQNQPDFSSSSKQCMTGETGGRFIMGW